MNNNKEFITFSILKQYQLYNIILGIILVYLQNNRQYTIVVDISNIRFLLQILKIKSIIFIKYN